MFRQIGCILLVSCTIGAAMNKCAYAAQETEPRILTEIIPSTLVDEGNTAQVRAFDIAPDGSTVAVLYASWKSSSHGMGEELWVATWSVFSSKLLWKQKIGTDSLAGAAYVRDVKDLVFTADQSRLLALGTGNVWSIDAKSGVVLESIRPPSPALGAPAQLLALHGATVAITYQEDRSSGFYTSLIDASSSRNIKGWHTSSIPQSFSADGKLAIAVIPGHGAADLEVIDAATGANLRTVAVASEKRHPDDGVFAVAKFLDDTHVVVSSNHRIDRPRKHAAYSLEFIDASNGQLIREITPEYFRRDGDIVVAADRNRFAVESVYARERDLLWDSPRPRDLRVNLLVFSRDGTVPEKVISNMYAWLPGGKGKPLRLSSDGSVLGVSESPSGSIKVFQVAAR
jgi:outer membrane protein assembly factor BamB